MSFTPGGRSADRSFELVRRSLLEGDGLPFQDALTVEQMRRAFDAEGVAFGDANDVARARVTDEGRIVYARGVTLWAMLSQALFTDVQRSCQAAVQRVAIYGALLGRVTRYGLEPVTETTYTSAQRWGNDGVTKLGNGRRMICCRRLPSVRLVRTELTSARR